MSANPAPLHRWTRRQYERMVATGVFDCAERVELIDGSIIDMAPQSSRHSTAVRLVEEALRKAFGKGFDIRVQMPLAVDDRSEPEPDVAVVTGAPRDYRDAHPRTAVLVVEVADTSLALDRGGKRALYARNAIPEYWIVDVNRARLEVCRQPLQGDYQVRDVLDGNAAVQPLAGGSAVAVADLLP
ncbi:MAG: Uma2 family endonuclease [Pseudomonadota bacterium]|nr:Uma2 family endonuclease [Pseudomonadota bacterium]